MSSDLFSSRQSPQNQPLAYRMSPRTLDEYIGQEHIVGPGRLLKRVIQADRLSSLIFFGPPGTGKTSLARVIARTTSSSFTSLNAVLTGVKELRAAIKEAQEKRDLYGARTILFIDEVHRWNKAQQDALLPWVENGTVVLIGATTQNPYFEVNPALVSRSRIFQLLPLEEDDLKAVVRQTLNDRERGYGKYAVHFEEGALEHLVHVSSGDARSLLNALELAVETTPDSFPPAEGTEIFITMDAAEQSIQKKAVLYDKEGDYHFDTISAFIKSIRGSDPDAAVYWLSRMVYAGEDPRFIFRRMLISASEDIGLADPGALGVVESAAAAFDRVGMPEGRHHLAHAALYLATAPKSNSVLGFFDALSMVESENKAEIPSHLKDANRDSRGFGHGQGYMYPHAYRDHWVAQQYLPSALQGKIFYRPSNQGYEARIETLVAQRREAQLAASVPDEAAEILTFSPPDKSQDRYFRRILDTRNQSISRIRETVFSRLKTARHHNICVLGAEEGTLLWEAVRRVPEGGVTGILSPSKPEREELLRHYGAQLDPAEQPELWLGTVHDYLQKQPERKHSFEFVIGKNVSTRGQDKPGFFRSISQLLVSGGTLVLSEIVPCRSQRLSTLLNPVSENQTDQEALELLLAAEERLYLDPDHPLLNWDVEDLTSSLKEAGFDNVHAELLPLEEQRLIRPQDIDRWLGAGRDFPTIGTHLSSLAEGELIEKIKNILKTRLSDTPIHWESVTCILSADNA